MLYSVLQETGVSSGHYSQEVSAGSDTSVFLVFESSL